MTTHRQRREAGLYVPSGGARPTDPDEMTKAQLLEYAQELGLSPANQTMSKDELRAAVDQKLAEG
jgi:hypothetical protein